MKFLPLQKTLTLIFALTMMAFAVSPSAPVRAQGMNVISAETEKGKRAWTIELASDDASRTKGLMFRKSMPLDEGMLFRFEQKRPVAMWMKNTFIPLDMIFLDGSGEITHIHRGAVPQSLDIISSQGPARFVLELNAGQADDAGLKIGAQLKHPWFLPKL